MIYFDNSATTPVCPEAANTALRYMTEQFYNPAAAYSPAVSVERDVNAARARLASYLNAEQSELILQAAERKATISPSPGRLQCAATNAAS